MKRFLVAAILVILLIFVFGVAFALETKDGLQYRAENDGRLTITGYIGNGTDINIPGEIDGKSVTAIGNGAFIENRNIKSVAIAEGIVTIGKAAFSNCSGIESIELPDSLATIEEEAFLNCFALKSIQLPEGIQDIPKLAFSGCNSLTEITLPSSIKTIGTMALAFSGYQSITLNEGLQTIGSHAFMGNNELESITVPNNVKEIGVQAFSDSKKLKSVILPVGLKKIVMGLIINDLVLEKVAIPKGVTTIQTDAFKECYKLNIWGFKGSEAEKFAKKNNIPFITVELVQEVRILLNGEDVSKGKLFIDMNTDVSTLQLSFQTSPENPWPGVTLKSSDAKVASVDSNGIVTGLKKGKATITAIAVDGSGKKTTCEITVARLAKKIVITGVNSLQAGKKATLIVEVHPDATDTKTVVWSTSDKDIATVDTKGIVTAKKVIEEKTVTLTATAKDGSGVYAEFVMTITP